MKRIYLFALSTLIALVACEKSSVVDLRQIKGYDINYDTISYKTFQDKFQSGWYCSAIYDVYPDGSLGKNYMTINDYSSELSPNEFIVDSNNRLKVYSVWDDFDGTHYNYRYSYYAYDETNNKLTFLDYHTVYYTNPRAYVSLTEGCVISLTDTHMDLVAPVWGYNLSSSDAVYTLFKFNRLSEERINKLETLATER